MEYLELKKAILNKTLPKHFMMAGDESLIQIYLDKIVKFNTIKRLNSVNDYIQITSSKFTKSLEDVIYVISNDDIFKSDTSLWNINRDRIIFIYTNLKKSDKFYKAFEPDIVFFNKLTNQDMIGGIKYKLNISDEDIQWLINSCDNDYLYIMNELDKITIFNKEDQLKLFQEYKQFHSKTTNEPFAFSNAISNRDKITALETIAKTSKYEVIKHLVGAYTTLKNQLLVQNHVSKSKDIEVKATELGMSKGMYYMLSKKSNTYSIKELCRALLFLSESINKVKLGLMEAVDACYLFVLECM